MVGGGNGAMVGGRSGAMAGGGSGAMAGGGSGALFVIWTGYSCGHKPDHQKTTLHVAVRSASVV